MKYSCYVSVSEQIIFMRRVWPSLWGLRAGSGQTRSFSTPSASATKVPTQSDQDNKLSYVSLFYILLAFLVDMTCLLQVSYESTGQSQAAKPLIIQHALFGRKENLVSLGKKINHITKRSVIIPDARNHGNSPKCTNPSVKQMSSDLLGLQSQLQVPQASLLGFSTGGRVAMMAALSAPKMVDRLVVASGSPLNTQQTLEKWERFQEAAHIVHTLLKSHGISSKSEMHEADFKLKLEIDEALKSTLKDRAGRALFLSNLGKSKLKSLMNNPDMGRFPNVDDKCFNGPVMFISGKYRIKYTSK